MFRIYILLATASIAFMSNADATIPWQASSKERYQGKEVTNSIKSSHHSQAKPKAGDKAIKPHGLATTGKSSQATLAQQSLQQQAEPAKFHPVSAAHIVDGSDFWIYDAYLTFLEDIDHDGYHYRFELAFDVDTAYAHADVYARLYLGDGVTFKEYHTTSIFHIDNTDSDDKFYVETELLSGYAPYDYDIQIELYEAHSNHLVAIYDHLNDTDLSYVPLESYNYETLPSPPPTVVRSRERGGSNGAALTLLLGLLALTARRRKKKGGKQIT